MYKRKRLVLLTFALIFSAILFSVGFFNPFNLRSEVDAGSVFDDHFVQRFESEELEGNGSIDLSSNGKGQYFNLQSRFLATTGFETPDRPLKPVFSMPEMYSIEEYNPMVYTNTGSQNDAGFVILDDTAYISASGTFRNYVVLEIQKLESVSILQPNGYVKFNGLAKTPLLSSAGTADAKLIESLANPNNVYYDNNSVCGVFNQPGYYEFEIRGYAQGTHQWKEVYLKFGFFIANAGDYTEDAMPVIKLNAAGQPTGEHTGITRKHNPNNIENPAIPGNGDSYYYQIQDTFQSINYITKRFEIIVEKNLDSEWIIMNDGIVNEGVNKKKYTFGSLGTYRVTSQMTFPYTPSGGTEQIIVIPESRYKTHYYYMNIFGFQSFYQAGQEQSELWFGGKNGTNSDVTGNFNEDDINYDLNGLSGQAQIQQSDSAIRWLVNDGNPSGIKTLNPVVTNMPPVVMRGNVMLAYQDQLLRNNILSRVAYKPYGSSTWQYKEYNTDGLFYDAGEYAVILYYRYDVANKSGESEKIYMQMFYFRIDNFCADVKITYGSEKFTFSEFLGERVFVSDAGFGFEFSGAGISPYGVEPKIGLTFKPADTAAPTLSYLNFIANQSSIITQVTTFNSGTGLRTWKDGTYTWQVYYFDVSGRFVPYGEFVVIVDSTLITDFSCVSAGVQLPSQYMPSGVSNISVFGAGEVTLSWGVKESGVGMKIAELDYYAIKESNWTDLETTVSASIIGGSHEILAKESETLHINEIINKSGTVTGYTIAERMTAPGIYIIKVTDDVGNISRYTFIIDDSVPRFAQSKSINPQNQLNVQTGPVVVGFGDSKLIYPHADVNPPILVGVDPIINGSATQFRLLTSGIYIPVIKKEESTDGINFTVIQDKTKTLTQEGVYFYRITDALGNVATHYIQISYDLTQPILFEDDLPNSELSATATMILNGGISNRDYLTFSIQQANNTGAEDYVHTVKVAFYDLTFNTQDQNGFTNTNYPFSDKVTYIEEINIASKYPGIVNERIFININQTPTTKQGLYVISRVCGNRSDANRVKNFYFIVDRNTIISSTNYESGIKATFGSGADTKIATYKNFQPDVSTYIGDDGKLKSGNNKILQGNNGVVISLPTNKNWTERVVNTVAGGTPTAGWNSNNYSNGTKYGNAVFNILTGDFTEAPQYVAFRSLALSKTVYRQDSVSKVFSQYSSALTTSGLYSVAFTDGSGGIPWMLGSTFEAPEKNRSEILIELFINMPQGAFSLNGAQIASSEWQPTQPANPTSANPSQNMASTKLDLAQANLLKFSFSNNSEGFLHTIASSGAYEPIVRLNNTILNRNTAPMTYYVSGSVTTYEITMPLRVSSVNIKSGDIFTVTLNTTGGTMPIVYSLAIDNSVPFSNLDKIMNNTGGDKWFTDKTNYLQHREKVLQNAGGQWDNYENPLKYPFAISNSFAFKKAETTYTYASGNPNFDTYKISYYEVNSRLSNISGETVINYGDVPFAEIVKLAANENRYFRIIEYDEIGNRVEYFVQLRGAEYLDNITANGLTEYNNYFDYSRPTGELITGNIFNRIKLSNGQYRYAPARGIDISVTADGLQDFFNNNLFFEMTCVIGSVEYKIQRFGLEPTVPTSGKGNLLIVRTVGEFAVAMQKILDLAKNAPVILKIDNRFDTYSVEIRHIESNMSKLYLGKPQAIAADVWVSVGAYDESMSTFFDSGFWAEVYEYQSGNNGAWTIYPFMSYLSGGLLLENSVLSDLLITVFDEFGRLVKVSYNGKYGSDISLSSGGVYSGNDLYYGKAGATITYVESAYEWFYLYRNDELVYVNGNSIGGFNASGIIITEWSNEIMNVKKITILPENGRETNWRAVAVMRGIPEKTWEREFNFYEVLPEIAFNSPSGDVISISEEVSGIMVVTYSNNGLLFNASAGYWRTPLEGGESTYTPIGAYMPKFNLTSSGYYEMQIINTLGASLTYTFTIIDSSNRSYKVFIKNENNQNKEVLASPERFSYEGTKIPHYFVKSFDNISVMPTSNNDYQVQGYVVFGTARIYTLKSDTTNSILKIAITCVENSLSSVSVAATASTGWQRTDGSNDAYGKYVSFYDSTAGGALAKGTITIGLSGLTSINYNTEIGNFVYMEYYRNGTKDGSNGDIGEYCGTLIGAQKLVLNAKDYGYYTFYVYDHAGNVKKFGNASDTDYYTVINMGRGPLVASSFVDGLTKQEPIVDDMVYNDLVALSVMPLPYNAFTPTGGLYPYARSLVIWKNNEMYLVYSAENITEASYGWILNEPGFYRIEFAYRISFDTTVYSRHSFTIVSSTGWQQSFSFNASSKMEIVGLTLNGIDIRKNYPEKNLKSISLNSSVGIGVYTMTVQQDADNIYTSVRTRVITVRIRSLTGIGITFSGVDFGGSTTKKVQINWIPSVIYNLYGETEIWIMRDGKNPEKISIGPNQETGLVDDVISSVSENGAGTYSVYLVSAGSEYYDGVFTKGFVYFQDGFKINETMNFLSILFIILAVSAVAVTLFIFIKMRIGMRVK